MKLRGFSWRTGIAFIALLLCAGRAEAQGIDSIHSFDEFDSNGDNGDGGVPEAPLTAGTDGYLYGTTSAGGEFGDGTIFQMSTNGSTHVLHSFQDTDNGFFQYSGLALGPDGNFYGTTYYGGANGNGSIYQITPGGTYTTTYSFTPLSSPLAGSANSDGAVPYAGLVYDAGTGLFYGTTTQGGAYGYGTVFSVTPGTVGTLNPMYSFSNGVVVTSPNGDGNSPEAVLAIGPDGALYGTTYGGGSYDAGTAFRITTGSSFSTIHVFTQGLDGGAPSGLTLGSDDNFYGTATNGGQNNNGCVFQMTTSGSVNTLYSFTNGDDGGFPLGGVIFGPGGQLYGTTSDEGAGGNAAGTVFSMPPAVSTPWTIYTFGDVWTEGAYPSPSLVNGPVGPGGESVYGVTTNGGQNGTGTVFGVSLAVTPFPGTYDGLFNDGSGYISITLSANGKFTGKVIVGAASHSLKGRFNSGGAWQGSSSGHAVAVSLLLAAGQAGEPGSYSITGLANGTAFTAWHAVYGKGEVAAETGKDFLQFTATSAAAGIPQVPGNVTLTVHSTGSAHLSGKLPDGTAFGASAAIVGGGAGGADQCLIYSIVDCKHATPRGARGFVVGAITFPAGVVTGPLNWIKPAQTTGPFPAAIDTGLAISP